MSRGRGSSTAGTRCTCRWSLGSCRCRRARRRSEGEGEAARDRLLRNPLRRCRASPQSQRNGLMFASLSGVTTNKQRGLFLFTLRVTSRLAHLFTIIWIADFPLILPTFRRHASGASTIPRLLGILEENEIISTCIALIMIKPPLPHKIIIRIKAFISQQPF